MKQTISTTGPPRADVWAAWQHELQSQRDAKLATDLRQREPVLFPRFSDYYGRLLALPRWGRGIGQRLWQSLIVGVALVLFVGSLPEAQSADTVRVSVGSMGQQGNGPSNIPEVSADGKFVVFQSQARNLVPNDTNNGGDIFVHDSITGKTTRVSVDSAGNESKAHIHSNFRSAAISGEGRFVTFYSSGSDLVPNDTNGLDDVFVHDLETGETTRVSVASDGTQGNGQALHPDISADGRFVAFDSWSSNLVPGDSNGKTDVFVHDRRTGTTMRRGNRPGASPAISDDGQIVAYTTLVGRPHVYVHNAGTGRTQLVSKNSSGTAANGASWGRAISGNGRLVAFASSATNLVPNDANGGEEDVFVHDLVTGKTEIVNINSSGEQGNAKAGGPAISRDGRFIAYSSNASNLVANDVNERSDVFVHDRREHTTVIASVSGTGNQASGSSLGPAISAEGEVVVFWSFAEDLVPNDTNRTDDVFLRRLVPAVVAGPVVNPMNGNDYYLLQLSSWTDAHEAADRMDGHLVTINDGTENSFVFETFMPLAKNLSDPDDPNLWIGLNDAETEGEFVWTSSAPVAFTNWDTGEPNDNLGNEDYGLMPYGGGGVWNDAANDAPPYKAYGVVEVKPAPPEPKLANSLVTLEPGNGTYYPAADSDGCPVGFVGQYGFDATLANTSQYPLSNIHLEVRELTNGNLLRTSNGLIGVGELYPVPLLGEYGDGALGPSESIIVHLRTCLKKRKPFQFFVDVLAATVATIKLEAHIDGRSRLILHGGTAQWFHLDYAAPGRHEFQNRPTVINGTDWYPIWPDARNEENRDCDCFSDKFVGLTPELPLEDFGVTLRPIKNRHITQVVQYPVAANGYTLIIEFDDNPPGGSDDYIVEVQVEYAPYQ